MNAVLILVTLSLAQVSPTPKVRAGALLDQGNRAFKNGHYEEALQRYEEAYATYASPKITLNIAQALVELGRGPEAAKAYDETLAGLDSQSSLRPVAQAARQRLVDQLVQLTVSSTPAATLFVDEQRISSSDAVYLAAGERALRLEAPGHVTWRQTTLFLPGRRHLTARLEPLVQLAEVDDAEGDNTAWWVAGGVAAAVALGVIVGVVATSGDNSAELGVTALSDWQQQ